MTELPEAIAGALSGPYGAARPRTVPTVDQLTPGAILDALKAAHGVHGGAKSAGIDRRTFQRAVNRTGAYKPQASTLVKLRAAYDRLRPQLVDAENTRVRKAREGVRGHLARKGGRLAFQGTVCVSNDCRPNRKIDLSQSFTPSTRAGILRAYEGGDLDQAAERFETGLNRDFLENDADAGERGGMYVTYVNWMEWR